MKLFNDGFCMKKMILLFILVTVSFSSEFKYRKYQHVKIFYKELSVNAIKIAQKYHIPPAALLAISGLESGYGRGYVCQITGNVLSLGAYKSDKELPSLYLPWCDSQEAVLFDKKDIKKCPKNELHFKQRPKSLKRDYRPNTYAGSSNNLTFFKYNAKAKHNANYRCLEDFASRWINKNSNIKAFKEARMWLDLLIKKEGKEVLYRRETNVQFINKIGGIKNSFNYRATWPKKVLYIMDAVGLVPLVKQMSLENLSFAEAWDK